MPFFNIFHELASTSNDLKHCVHGHIADFNLSSQHFETYPVAKRHPLGVMAISADSQVRQHRKSSSRNSILGAK